MLNNPFLNKQIKILLANILNIFVVHIFLPFEWVSCGNCLQELGLGSSRSQGFSVLVEGAPEKRKALGTRATRIGFG